MEMPGAFRLDQRFRYRTRKGTCVTTGVLDLKTSRVYLGKVTESKAIRGDGYFTWKMGDVTV